MAGLVIYEIAVLIVNINFPVHVSNRLCVERVVRAVPNEIIAVGKRD